MQIPFSTMDRMHAQIRTEMLQAFEKVYDKGWFIQGEECSAFEEEFASYTGAQYAVGVGTSAAYRAAG